MEKTSCGNFFFAFSKKFSKKSSKWYRNKKSLLYYVVKKEKASGMGCDEKTRNTLSVSRREVKNLLSLPDRLYLLDALDRLLTPDAYGGYNGYTVRSVYFDSIVNEDYMDKKNHADEKNGLSGSGSKRVYR